jgi:ligand-binding sensor domain-containing protein/signal transduction histidine kinase/DNA-binding response OmpR family regulator
MDKLFSRNKIMIILLVVVFILIPRLQVRAAEEFTSNYSQTNYTEEDGFESGEANCICQSASGYIWIGTDSGLYRYDGSEFRLFSMDDSMDGSIYSINCIILTSEGNLYVGTENYGLFLYDQGKFYRVSSAYNENIVTVNDMYEDEEGAIWLATSEGIYILKDEETTALEDEGIQGADITCVTGLGNQIYAIANNDTMVYIQEGAVKKCINKSEYTDDDLSCMYVDEEGVIYYGTVGHSIIRVTSVKDYEVINTGSVSGINKIVGDENRIWLLADDGVAYVGAENKIKAVSGLNISESISDMITDYEGNYWITSYRKGLLLLEKSKFKNMTIEYKMSNTIVNSVIKYGDKLYVGTDDGLVIINSDRTLDKDSELVDILDGKSVRNFYIDSKNRLWICSYRIYGVICLNRDGSYAYYNKSEAGLTSNAVNCIIELNDGSMAVGTENGISILQDGKTVKVYTRYTGMENADIISLYQNEDGILYAGSNGSGMYTIDLDSNVKKISAEDGLNSNVVTSILKGSTGIWIGTDNGLYYQEGVIRQISSVDSSNSISDIIMDADGYLWIFGSKGIQKYYENDLLSTAEPPYESFTKSDGLISSITDASTNYIDENGIVYVCCDEGICSLDYTNLYINEVAPNVRISSVTVDEKEYAFSEIKDEIKVPGDTNRITVEFSVLSYVNRNDIQVKYYLEGFEDKERILSGKDQLVAEYTNLEGGNYTFVLSAQNADGVECQEILSFRIEKELKFWETSLARNLVIAVILLLCIIAILIIGKVYKIIKSKNEEVEELSKKSAEAEKSNQAKNDYVNYLSHEIRVPLNSVLATSEMLLRNSDHENTEELNQLTAIYDSSYDILEIVDGISRLSNLQDGNVELSASEYAVSDIIYELSSEYKNMINRDLISLKVSIEDDIPNGLIGDAAKVKEIITNIYSRAVKTTKEGSISINIDWRKCKTSDTLDENGNEINKHEIYLDFVISDTGIGVKEERLDSFFDLDDAYDRNDIGNFDISIGLAIARQLIEIMEGTAEVESTYGAGTTVSFSIKQKVFDYSHVNYNANHRRELAFRKSNSRIWLPDVRILIVDDSDVSLQVAKVLFESYELMCDTVVSGFEAIDKVMLNKYDLIFIDTVMPVMDGKDTVREIKSLDGEEYRKIPIIAMSENNIDSTRDEIISNGFDDVLVKPLEVEEIEGIFRMFLPEDKIKEKTNDIKQYISESRFKDDVKLLENSIAVENALKMIGGNFDTFNRFLDSFKREYENEVAYLGDYLKEDVRRYRNIIHDIKSSSGNIGAFSIERKAANLEAALNIGNMQYARENTREFITLLNNVFKDIDKYLTSIEYYQPQEKEMKESPDRQLLKDMRTALREGDIKSVDAMFMELDKYNYGEVATEFLSALTMTVEAMDYEGASEIIDQYLNSI